MEWLILVLIGIAAQLAWFGNSALAGRDHYRSGAAVFRRTPWISWDYAAGAAGTSLFTMIFTGLSSTLAYMKHKTIDYKSGLIFLSEAALGVYLVPG